MRKFIIKILFIIMLALASFQFLERSFNLNEIIAFSGLLFFISKFKYYIRNHITKYLVVFQIFGAIYLVYSYFFLKDGNDYQFIRTIPVWFSTFCFYTGIEFYQHIKYFKNANKIYLLSFFFLSIGLFTGSLAIYSIAPIVFMNTKRNYLYIASFYLLISIFKPNQSFVIFLITVLIIYFLFQKLLIKKISLLSNKIIITISLVVFVVSFFWIVSKNSAFYSRGYRAFTASIENNMIWRIMFWDYEFRNNIINNPVFGIGFGTKLYIRDAESWFIYASSSKSELKNIEYVHGTHNSFIFVLIRLGFVGLLLVLAFFSKLLTCYNKLIKIGFSKHNEAFFLAFCVFCLNAFFNVILESPLYGGAFWCVTGLFYQSMQKTSLPNIKYSTQKSVRKI